jgi:hypothetical protein
VTANGDEIRVVYSPDYTTASSQYDALPDRVWKALLATHEALGIPIESADPRTYRATFFVQVYSHRIGGQPAVLYVDCGFGAAGQRAGTYRLRLKVSHSLESIGDKRTQLNTLLQITAHNNEGVSGDELPCTTTGALEKRISSMVAAQMHF